MRPFVVALLSASAAIALPLPAAAQSKQQCADAYVEAQVARKENRLRDARVKLETCASSACPASIRKDCVGWRTQADKDMPTVAVTVVDAAGAPVPGARVTLDGSPIEASGSPQVDPGEHVLRVEASGMTPHEQKLSLAAGAGRRTVSVSLSPLGPLTPTPEPGAGRGVPVAPIVLGSIGLAALGVFIGMGTVGNGKKADLDAAKCKPNCSADDVSAIKTMYIGADIGLGVGIASLVTAGVVLIVNLTSRPKAEQEPKPAEKGVSFSPARGGGSLVVRF